MSQSDSLSERRANLSPAKRALFEQWQRGNLKKIDDGEVISRRQEQDAAPLSFAQQHMWNFERLHPGSSVYNIPFGDFVLQGPLDIVALERSLNEIIQRHEILRTTFAKTDDRTVQIVAPTLTLSLPVLNLQEFPEQKREEEARQLALAELLRPFDLTHGPLLRACLLRLSENEHVLLLNAHHSVCDGWSRGIFLRELSELYSAFGHGKPSPLPALPIQYADYSTWQNQRFQGRMLQTQVDYWRQQLKGAPDLLKLPGDHMRPHVRSYRSNRQFLTVSRVLVDRLRVLGQQEDVTLFMVLLAAFNIMLYRSTGQEDILVGTPISNRHKAEIEKLIGCFVNTLVIRTNTSGNPGFRELLRQVRKVTLEAYAHQILSFEKLVEELHSPLIQAMFIMHNVPLPGLKLEGIALHSLDVINEVILYDLTMVVLDLDREQGLSVFLRYRCDVFDDATITQMLSNWLSLLEAIDADPDQRIRDVPLKPLA